MAIEFENDQEAQDWLKVQSRETVLAIQTRAALRQFPTIWYANATSRELDGGTWNDAYDHIRRGFCVAVRALMVNYLVTNYPEIMHGNVNGLTDVYYQANSRSDSIDLAPPNFQAFPEFFRVYGVARAPSLRPDRLLRSSWRQTEMLEDCTEAVSREPSSAFRTPLWTNEIPDDELREETEAILNYKSINGDPWAVWAKWFRSFYDGAPPPVELVQRILTEIDRDTWVSSPVDVANRVQEIEALYKAERHLPDEEEMNERIDHEDYEIEELKEIASDKQSTNIGTDYELKVRADVLEQIATLMAELPKPVTHGGIGHNDPPEEFEINGEALATTTESLDTLQAELAAEVPSIEVVADKASNLKHAVSWVASKLDKTFDEFCKGFGSTLGKASGYALPLTVIASPYWGKLVMLLESLKVWLQLALGI